MPSRIDVVCPTYNRAELLRAAMLSVLEQSVRDWRMIIVSDGSTDDTEQVVRSFDDPRVSFVAAPHSGHPGGPRNRALAAATAPYVAYLDDDDRWRPNHLEVLLGMLERGARWVGTGNVHVADDGRELNSPSLFGTVWHPDLQLMLPMYEPSRIGHVRGIAEAAGGWATERIAMEDWDLWLRLAEAGERLTVTDELTVVTRFDPKSRQRTAEEGSADIVLGTVPSEDAAERVLAEARSASVRADLRRFFHEDMRKWLLDMYSSGSMSLPPGRTDRDLVRAWDEMDAKIPATAELPLTSALTCRPGADGYAVVIPVPCLDDTHADRVRTLLSTVDRRRLDRLRDLVFSGKDEDTPAR